MDYIITITLNTDNEAFGCAPAPEVKRVMDEVSFYTARKISQNNESFNIHFPQQRSFNDYNGNAVCTVTINKEG